MQEPNWNNFKAKFDGKEQKSFEWFCYMLFCKEFNRDTGVFRYKDQWGIETEPIKTKDRVIGFQSKFYDTKISENKEDIKSSIGTAKEKNPTINKILFYLNQEFSESSKKDTKEPSYKIEIETYAKSQGVEIEWRTKSFFESPFVCEKNATIAQHFFSGKKSIFDFINELIRHTEAILLPIKSKIIFRNHKIKLDRSQNIKTLQDVLEQHHFSILSGKAGVGKTAIIKDFYESVKEKAPFYVFKANEFNIPNINQLFAHYGAFTLSDFIEEHQNFEEKYLIIDSAEKLSDIEFQESFQEFLTTLQNSKWKVIFTTRHSYLDDLRFQFINIYSVRCLPVEIENIKSEVLYDISDKFTFKVPNNNRLHELISIPFYLDNYLQNYEDSINNLNYAEFRTLLWNKHILKSSYKKNNTHIKREKCFLKIAHKRVTEGHLFVKVHDCDDEILTKLEADEVIKYDNKVDGYFITHDIYEEWALDIIIERCFHSLESYSGFFHTIGCSLPIRRAFRNWLSEKLFNDITEIKTFIENVIHDNAIDSYWKDEIYISILLSDFSENFFHLFEEKLLSNNQEILEKIIFLLRIACKEVDEDFLNLLGIKNSDWTNTILTKPKGNGWKSTIKFIHNHISTFELKKSNIIIPLLNDWNNKNKEGTTTKYASRIALYYYNNEQYYYDIEQQLIRVILNGTAEIKDDLKQIFDEIINGDDKRKHYKIINSVLISLSDSIEVVKTLPSYVLKLADKIWFKSFETEDNHYLHSRRMGVEDAFGISPSSIEYFPASAFRTPIFQLLRIIPRETVDFILNITNKTVECYANSKLDGIIEQVNVFTVRHKPIKQYISNRLWCMYRGTQVSTYLLESIHMALEKWLLQFAKHSSKETIESCCFYLINKSKSASITSVVLSVVLSQPTKLFNIAKILFQTKEFFLYDTRRMMLDQSKKRELLSLKSFFPSNNENEFHNNERIKSCDESHRKIPLESLALNYQFFREENESEEDGEERQKIIWDILDNYYKELPDKSLESDEDKTWRLYLARMDRRKMNPETEESDKGLIIKFNPEIDPELRQHSEDALQQVDETMKYTGLFLWADFRFKKDEENYNRYPQYENNPISVLKEVKEIIKSLKNANEEDLLYKRSVLAYVCSVLMRDFFDKLKSKEKKFCKDIIITYASIPIVKNNYYYQIPDGTRETISLLPILMKHFPKKNQEIKFLLFGLLLSMFSNILYSVIGSIHSLLWDINFEDANSLFLGYLFLSQKYEEELNKEKRIGNSDLPLI